MTDRMLELIEKAWRVRRLVLRTRRLMVGKFAGFYASAFLGRGLEFEEVRPYLPGDDARSLDWNVTARRGELYVKRYSEERERTVWIAFDDGPTMEFGSADRSKREHALELAACIALAAAHVDDLVGLIRFGVDPFLLRPARGERQVMNLLLGLVDPGRQDGRRHSFTNAIDVVRRFVAGGSVVFLLSDFLDPQFRDSAWLNAFRKKAQLYALGIVDPWERELPDVGLARFRDRRSGATTLVDTGDADYRAAYRHAAVARERSLARLIARHQGAWIPAPTTEPPLLTLRRHFDRPLS